MSHPVDNLLLSHQRACKDTPVTGYEAEGAYSLHQNGAGEKKRSLLRKVMFSFPVLQHHLDKRSGSHKSVYFLKMGGSKWQRASKRAKDQCSSWKWRQGSTSRPASLLPACPRPFLQPRIPSYPAKDPPASFQGCLCLGTLQNSWSVQTVISMYVHIYCTHSIATFFTAEIYLITPFWIFSGFSMILHVKHACKKCLLMIIMTLVKC